MNPETRRETSPVGPSRDRDCRRRRAGRRIRVSIVCLLLCVPGLSSVASAEGRKADSRTRAEAGGFLYGIATGVRREPYRGYDRRVVVFPVLGYRGENLTVFGPFARYALARSGDLELSVRAQPRFAGYDESDSVIFDGMRERKPSFDVGLGLSFERPGWKLELSALRDALNRSDGLELGAKLGKVYRRGPVFVEPGLGLRYSDRRLVDYYYGVEPSEAAEGRPAYDAEPALNASLGVEIRAPAFLGGFARLGIEHDWFDSSIADSPLTDADSDTRIFFTYSRFFDG